MQIEITKGFLMFAVGIVGIALTIIIAIIAGIKSRSSFKMMQEQLDEIYKMK